MGKKVASGIMLTGLFLSVLTLAFNIQLIKAEPTTWTVDDDGPADFHTIQEAIDAASSGDEVFVKAGIYDEHLYLDKSISLLGENKATTIIDGQKTGIVLRIEEDNITISGFTIQNSGITLGYDLYEDSGIMIWSYGNNISGNNIRNNRLGIYILDHHFNTISGNNITNNYQGVKVLGCYWTPTSNKISGNNIENNECGFYLQSCSNNIMCGNNITDNGQGIGANDASNNVVYHNNLVDNMRQYGSFYSTNVWDGGYPSGGNYWSDYTGVDLYRGSNQNFIGSDGIGDTPHTIEASNQDRYPLMSPWPSGPGLHDLEVTLKVPASLRIGNSTLIEATVNNTGFSNEQNVAISLSVNNTIVKSTTISLLETGSSYTINHLWVPTVEGTYNVTTYVGSVPSETFLQNNLKTVFVTVSVPAPPSQVRVGVKAGDWIKCTYTISGWPAGTPYPEWLKLEFLSVEGTSASVRVTMRMSNGTELSETVPVDIMTGGQALGLSGFVIPANSTVGDSVSFGGFGFIMSTATIEGETTRTYAGASRTVVYTSISQYGTQLTYYWDKQTGVMVEASTISGSLTATGKATETNIWEAVSSPFWMQWWFYAIVVVVILAMAGTVYFLKKRTQSTPTAPS